MWSLKTKPPAKPPADGFWVQRKQCDGYRRDTNPAFMDLVETACFAVNQTTRQIYTEFRISEPGGSYHYDGDTGLMTFTLADQRRCHAGFQRVGTWVRATHSFMWTWAKSGDLAQSEASRKARAHGVDHDMAVLTSPMLLVNESDSWHICSLVAYLSDLPMIYRAPVNERTTAYLALEYPVWEN